MAQLVDFLFVLVLLVALARRFPAIGDAVGRAFRQRPSTGPAAPFVDVTPRASLATVTCASCRTESPARARFCSHCGTSLLPSLN